MTTPRLFSAVGIVDQVPTPGHRCQFCGELLRSGSSAYKFAWIDPKDVKIEYTYTHILCGDGRMKSKAEETLLLSEEQIKKFWDGIEDMERRKNNAA